MSNVEAPSRAGLIACLLWLSACSQPPAPADASTASEPPVGVVESPPSATEPAATEAPSGSPAGGDLLPPSASNTATGTGPDTRGKTEIQQVIGENRQKVRDCYDAALKTNPGMAGALVVSFVINPDGSVKTAEVNWSESDLHVPELDTCAVEAVKTFKFPASSRGLESKVNYPFDFKPPRPKQ